MLGSGFTRGVVPDLDRSPGVEIWGTNRLMLMRESVQKEPWTRWFDLHRTPWILERRQEAYRWLQQQDGSRPVYQWDVNHEMPGSRAYPRAEVQAYFDGDRDFWGSISWMLALAIYEQFTDIELFWFPLMNDRATDMTVTIPVGQYTHQVPSTRYWIGQARGRGLRVTIHGDSALKPNHPLYGVETT